MSRYSSEEIERMRVAMAKRDAKILKHTEIFSLVYYGCTGYKTMPIEKIVSHYNSWKQKHNNED